MTPTDKYLQAQRKFFSAAENTMRARALLNEAQAYEKSVAEELYKAKKALGKDLNDILNHAEIGSLSEKV